MVGMYEAAGSTLLNAITKVEAEVVGSTISILVAGVIICATLYYMVMGLAIMFGRVQEPWSDFLKSGFKFMFIGALALNPGNYMEYIGGKDGLIRNTTDGISVAWGKTGHGTGMATPTTALGMVDDALSKTWVAAGKFFKLASDLPWVRMFSWYTANAIGILLIIAGIVVTLPAAIMIIIAQAMLSILIMVGPLFVMSLMFKTIQKWFDAWFSQVMTQILTIGLLCLIVGITGEAFTNLLDQMIIKSGKLGDVGSLSWFTGFNAVMLAVLLAYIQVKVVGLAAALGGGMAAQMLSFREVGRGTASVAAHTAAVPAAMVGAGMGIAGEYRAAKAAGTSMGGMGAYRGAMSGSNMAYNRFLNRGGSSVETPKDQQARYAEKAQAEQARARAAAEAARKKTMERAVKSPPNYTLAPKE